MDRKQESQRGGRERWWQDSPWPARSEAGERYMDTGGWWCLGPWGPCGWSGRGRAWGKGAPAVGDRRWRSEDEEEPQAEPCTIHPTARSNIQNSWPSWGFSLGSMAHAPPPTEYLKKSKADVQESQKKWPFRSKDTAANSIAEKNQHTLLLNVGSSKQNAAQACLLNSARWKAEGLLLFFVCLLALWTRIQYVFTFCSRQDHPVAAPLMTI